MHGATVNQQCHVCLLMLIAHTSQGPTPLYHTGSDRKLGGAWERAVHAYRGWAMLESGILLLLAGTHGLLDQLTPLLTLDQRRNNCAKFSFAALISYCAYRYIVHLQDAGEGRLYTSLN